MHMSCRDKLIGSMERGHKVSLNSVLVMVVGEVVGDNESPALLCERAQNVQKLARDFHVSYT